jgi:hypothetical protein
MALTVALASLIAFAGTSALRRAVQQAKPPKELRGDEASRELTTE